MALNPPVFQISRVLGSPAHWNSFWWRRSSGVATGLREKMRTQPPSAQFRATKPRARIPASRPGRMASRVAYTSWDDSKARGMLRANTDRSISARPWEVSTAPWREPRRILRTTSGSSPWRPPG